jgi:hypothetical protein
MWRVVFVAAFIGLIGCSGSSGQSECERSIERMRRPDPRGVRPALSARMAKHILGQCEKGGTAIYDELLQCARTQPIEDRGAERCIDEFLEGAAHGQSR